MKRTLTAAATLVVGSAGVVGLAGTATATESAPLPADLSMAQGMEQVGLDAASQPVRGAEQVVGEVLPMDKAAGEAPRAEGNRGQLLNHAAQTLDSVNKGTIVSDTLNQVDSLAPQPPQTPPQQPQPKPQQQAEKNPVNSALEGTQDFLKGQDRSGAPKQDSDKAPNGQDVLSMGEKLVNVPKPQQQPQPKPQPKPQGEPQLLTPEQKINVVDQVDELVGKGPVGEVIGMAGATR